MRRLKFAAVAFLSLVTCGEAFAGPPSYLLLKRASTPQGHRPGQPSGIGFAAPAQGYAYGWFGVCPRVHPERQMGSYRANTDLRMK